jgi:5-formyltetrahydrofolate cyclo-ligase
MVLNLEKSLFVPKILNKSGEMDFLRIYDKDDLASLPSGIWGIKEPNFYWRSEPRLKGQLTFPRGSLQLTNFKWFNFAKLLIPLI